MAFSETTKTTAYIRSGGRCECKRTSHPHHIKRCAKRLARKTAQFHHILSVAAGGSDGLANCQVLCLRCHKLTRSYGRH